MQRRGLSMPDPDDKDVSGCYQVLGVPDAIARKCLWARLDLEHPNMFGPMQFNGAMRAHAPCKGNLMCWWHVVVSSYDNSRQKQNKQKNKQVVSHIDL